MKIIVFVSKTGDWLVSFVAAILATVMLLYGGYALWDTAMLYQGAFVSQNLMKYKPSVSVDEDDASLEELLAINPDVRGWLTIDGTHVDYPIVQGEDDMEYVNKGVYGEFSLSGTVFLDSENTSDFSDCYNLLFGHHMANGAMFGDVVRFTDRTYFEKHQTGRLFYPDGRNYRQRVFAGKRYLCGPPVCRRFTQLSEYNYSDSGDQIYCNSAFRKKESGGKRQRQSGN